MITATNMLYIYTETPLHAGTGSGLSNVDLPIQRERTTQYPMIQGSGIKGKLRAAAEEDKQLEPFVDVIFGSSREIKTNSKTAKNGAQSTTTPTAKNSASSGNGTTPQDYAGALIVGDARILLFPVRSLNGIFAYTTSYDVLQRFARDLERSRIAFNWSIPTPPVEEPNEELPTALVSFTSDLIIEDEQPEEKANAAPPASTSDVVNEEAQPKKGSIVLEEFSFKAQADDNANGQVSNIAKWLAENALPTYSPENTYWQDKLRSSLVILPNDEFRDFVLYATEVITRISIERKTKIVKDGALWTEEHLPTDTLLYVPVYATNSRKNGDTLTGATILEKMGTLNSNPGSYLQLGGDETVGRGIVRTRWGRPPTV